MASKFDYVTDKSTRDLLVNAYEGITIAEGWEFIKLDIDSFMISSHPKIKEIIEQMYNLPNGGLHSGASFGCVMREMQLLAQYGEEQHKKLYKTKKD